MLPERIIVFRDGVSEGQLAVVKQYEVYRYRHFIIIFISYNA